MKLYWTLQGARMIRKFFPSLAIIILASALSACTAPGGRSSSSSDTTASTDATSSASTAAANNYGTPAMCDAQPVQNLVGQKFSSAVNDQARNGAGARLVRVLKPGEVMTMEYNQERLNVILDEQGAISALRCG